MYLFDTDTLSEIVKESPSSTLLSRLATVLPEHQFTTAITVGEMVYGAYKSNRPDHYLSQAEERIWPAVHILPFDRAAAEEYGRLRAELERVGTPIAEPDLRIAAIASIHKLTVITGNVRHFERVPGLQVENWI